MKNPFDRLINRLDIIRKNIALGEKSIKCEKKWTGYPKANTYVIGVPASKHKEQAKEIFGVMMAENFLKLIFKSFYFN